MEINKEIRVWRMGIHLRIFLDNLVAITQNGGARSKDRRQRQDMRRTM